MAHTENSIIINAPLDKVYEFTNDIEGWPQMFAEYTDAKILERVGNKITFQLTNKEGKSWRSTRVLYPQFHCCAAVREEPKFPFKYMHLFWHYEKVGGGTKMTWVQDFEMDPSSSYTDEKAVEAINQHSLSNMETIKKLIEDSAK